MGLPEFRDIKIGENGAEWDPPKLTKLTDVEKLMDTELTKVTKDCRSPAIAVDTRPL